MSKKQWLAATVIVVALTGAAHATTAGGGATGTEFTALHTMFVGWVEGFLGRSVAIGAVIIGAVAGLVRSTAMPALIGIVFAIVLTLAPTIITGMFGAII